MKDDLIDKIRLYRTKGIGALSFRYLVKIHKSAKAAIQAMKLTHIIPSEETIREEVERVYKMGGKFIVFDDENYPAYFNNNNSSPILTCLGNEKLLQERLIGVVGSRAPSISSIDFCKFLINNLEDVVIVSGMANGIDEIAHRTAKKTIAVFAGGLGNLQGHSELQQYLINNNHLIITEQPFDVSIRPYHFAQRNRIIASLCSDILIIEAREDSGSLITAEAALDMNKRIYVMPGLPGDKKNAGGNAFLERNIRQKNVFMLNGIHSIMRHMNKISDNFELLFDIDSTVNDKDIEQLLTTTPICINKLYTYIAKKMTLASLLAALARMELENKVIISNLTVCAVSKYSTSRQLH